MTVPTIIPVQIPCQFKQIHTYIHLFFYRWGRNQFHVIYNHGFRTLWEDSALEGFLFSRERRIFHSPSPSHKKSKSSILWTIDFIFLSLRRKFVKPNNQIMKFPLYHRILSSHKWTSFKCRQWKTHKTYLNSKIEEPSQENSQGEAYEIVTSNVHIGH